MQIDSAAYAAVDVKPAALALRMPRFRGSLPLNLGIYQNNLFESMLPLSYLHTSEPFIFPQIFPVTSCHFSRISYKPQKPQIPPLQNSMGGSGTLPQAGTYRPCTSC